MRSNSSSRTASTTTTRARRSSATASPAVRPPSTCRRFTACSTPRCCPNGCLRIACRCGCSCRSTSTSGLPTRVASDPSTPEGAVLLLSGGLDSYTAGAIAKAEGFRVYALTVRYGQRHAKELDAARAVAAALQVSRHIEIDVDLAAFGGSSLTAD